MGRGRQAGPRITLSTVAVLREMLAVPNIEHYGFALAEATGLSPGTVYSVLSRLEAQGWVSGERETRDPAELGRPRRRLYRLTETGAQAGASALATTRNSFQPMPSSAPVSALATSEEPGAAKPQVAPVRTPTSVSSSRSPGREPEPFAPETHRPLATTRAPHRPGRLQWPAASFLGRLSEPVRQEVLRLGFFREYASEEVLAREGDTTTFAVLLLHGWAKITAATEDGGFALLEICSGGNLVGEESSLDGEPQVSTAVAAGAVLAKVIPVDALAACSREFPEVGRAVALSLAGRLRSATRRRVELAGSSVAVRVARVILELERAYGSDGPTAGERTVGVSLTQPELAALVGAAEPTVHKALRDLRRRGVLTTGYRLLAITDMDALRAVAE